MALQALKKLDISDRTIAASDAAAHNLWCVKNLNAIKIIAVYACLTCAEARFHLKTSPVNFYDRIQTRR